MFPVLYAIYISLTSGAVNQLQFVGLAHYIQAFSSGEFWRSLSSSFLYAFLTIPITMIIALIFAALLFRVTTRTIKIIG